VLVVDGDHDEAIKREHTEYIASTIPRAGLLLVPAFPTGLGTVLISALGIGDSQEVSQLFRSCEPVSRIYARHVDQECPVRSTIWIPLI
jgi:hypothetical protein